MKNKTIKVLGNVNAAHLAIILNAKGEQIGYCMDTPNNAAYALSINPNAQSVKTPFNGTWERKELEKRFYGLEVVYHAQYVKYF